MENSKSGGIGFVGLLTIVFITLKLIGYIKWSWLWVLSPLWLVPFLIVVGLLIFMAFAIWKDYQQEKKVQKEREKYNQARKEQ